MISTNELRKKFLEFFKEKGHEIVASDTLVPKNDPSVLFTSAGMNQFKEQFLGKITGYRRAATSQKCLRTGDLEQVGKTAAHHTFFEMLGNFSFGDYFKKEAIQWAWEFLTQHLAIDQDKLRVSVYKEDQEAYAIWRDEIKLPEEKIYSFGQKENFWPSNAIADGPNGPCGPCSEIFFDRGKDKGCGKADCSPACDCGRFVEIWNLVFTQFNRKDGGRLEPLPSKNIDTGMGLERVVSCMQGVATNFEIDIFVPLIREIRKILSVKAPEQKEKIHCIADHVRAVIFAIGDGVLPSNEGRGYVVRKLIRRANWFGQELGYKNPFLYSLVFCVSEQMKEPYPELALRRDNIAGIIRAEEERFLSNIKEGGNFLQAIIESLQQKKEKTISGEVIFKLYDTYGFPVELTEMYAKEQGLELDVAGFASEMQKQKEKARTASAMSADIFAKDIFEILPSQFVGYETTKTQATVVQIIKSKQNIETLSEHDEAWVVLDKTPFYGESGGQIGDTGEVHAMKSKAAAKVADTKQIDGSIIHIVKVEKGSFKIGDKVEAVVDDERRQAIRRAHTATHLLQAALRTVLGAHVQQSGSLVEPDYFRFDFTHFKDLSDEELERVQDLLNECIRSNDSVSVDEMNKEEALKSGAIALFGEKYGQKVRVVSAGDYSKEFCGGTHLDRTGSIGLALIESESSIGSGVRRIEAVTGARAYAVLKKYGESISELSRLFKTPRENVVNESKVLLDKNRQLQKEIAALNQKNLGFLVPGIIERSLVRVGESAYLMYQFQGFDMGLLRMASDLFMEKLPHKTVLFLNSDNGMFILRTTKDLKGALNACELLNSILSPFGGSGGGRIDFAQGGVKDKAVLAATVKKAKEEIQAQLSKAL